MFNVRCIKLSHPGQKMTQPKRNQNTYSVESSFCHKDISFHFTTAKFFVALQAHMPAADTEITIWGVKGGPPLHFLGLNLIFFVA